MRAIDIYVAFFKGNQSKAARAIDKKPGHVWHWVNKAPDMPVSLVPRAAEIIGKKASDLRPDLWGEGIN